MQIDFKALAAGLGAAALMAWGGHAHSFRVTSAHSGRTEPPAKQAAQPPNGPQSAKKASGAAR